MPIFISYSHADLPFVDKLARNLVLNRRNVWIDRWELNVGDSLIARIQDALEDASSLLVVLSEASTASEWCKKEVSAGLLRELEERRVVVLPVLLDDCAIPLLLRDKVYADFRNDFDEGLAKVLEATAATASQSQGRVEEQYDYKVDWSIDWRTIDGHAVWTITLANHSVNLPFTILTEVSLVGDPDATRRFEAYCQADLQWIAEREVVEALRDFMSENPIHLLLQDAQRVTKMFHVHDPQGRFQYAGMADARWLGQDTGRDIVLRVDEGIERLAVDQLRRSREPTAEEHSRFLAHFAR